MLAKAPRTRAENEAIVGAWSDGQRDYTRGKPQAAPHEFVNGDCFDAYLRGWSHAANDHDATDYAPDEFFFSTREVN